MTFDPKIAKALSHPLRVQILELLQGKEASPAMLTKEMGGVVLGLIAYHVQVLEECGYVELVRTRPRRGAVEHLYRARPVPFFGGAELRSVPRSLRGKVTAMSLQKFIDASIAALEAGTMDEREDTVLGGMVIGVDELGWAQAAEIARSALASFQMIHDQSRARTEATGNPLTPVVVGVAGFEAADVGRREGP